MLSEPTMSHQKELLDSACDFLAEALENHRDRKDTFAIVHAVTACELMLKERLARIHPNLIFRNVDSRSLRNGTTVSLSGLPQRLANFGVPLHEKDQELVSCFAEWRNQVVHHLPSYDPSTARARLPKLLDFLVRFIQQHLQSDLKDLIPKRLYRTALEVLEEWQPMVAQARETAHQAGEVVQERCPRCGASGVLTKDSDNRVTCHLCGVGQYVYDHCTQCGKSTPVQLSAFITDQSLCDDCVEEAGDAYLQHLIDMERGK